MSRSCTIESATGLVEGDAVETLVVKAIEKAFGMMIDEAVKTVDLGILGMKTLAL